MSEPRPLTPYERQQVQEIARWKNCRPSVLAELIDTVTSPVTWAVGLFVPRSLVTRLMTSLEAVDVRADVLQRFLAEAGLDSLADVAALPLESCDRLAWSSGIRSERVATFEGIASSFAGPLVHVPQQLLAGLRSITRIGHCYGYSLDDAFSHAVVIDILEIATLQDVDKRRQIVELLHTAIDERSGSVVDDHDFVQSTGRSLIADGVLDLVPIVGEAMSFLLDSQFIHAVDEVARRIFQERWLRDRHLVRSIPIAALPERTSSLREISLAIGQTLYSVGAVCGFAAGFPARLVQRAAGGRSPAAMGVRHGTGRAVRDAREFIEGLGDGMAGLGGVARGETETESASGKAPT